MDCYLKEYGRVVTEEEYNEWRKKHIELFEPVNKDYQMSLIELDHKFSMDLLKW